MAEPEKTQRDSHTWAPVKRVVVEVVDGPDAGTQVVSEGDAPVTVGSAQDNTLRLQDRKVSRYHLELARHGESICLQDLSSLNGTWSGNLRIERASAFSGSRVRVGSSVLELRDGELSILEPPDSDLEVPGFIALGRRSVLTAQELRQVAPSKSSVLLQGETGTGKEVAARAIHDLSPRKDKPFVIVDCASMAPSLIASELFGHEKGAFTGAEARHVGAFEQANGGTVFLDEIGELPLTLQPALLGVLERRRFRRVGGKADVNVDVRVIAATHRDLRASVNDGSFRADVYFRLAVARIQLAPLRERPEDIPPLVRHFVRELTGDDCSKLFSKEVMETLQKQRWSGNVRELRNVVESALTMGTLRLESSEDGAVSVRAATSGVPVGPGSGAALISESLAPYRQSRTAVLNEFELNYLRQLKALCGDNASEAARRARMDRNYLVSLYKKHGLR